MRTRTWCVAVLLVASSGAAAGQTVLSEADALSRLSSDSPRLRAIRASIDVARADALAAGRWPNPRLTVEREAVAGVAETLATVLQPLPVTGLRGLERGAASALATAAERRVDDEIRRARSDLRVAFSDLMVAQAREQELTATRDRLQVLAEMLAKREAAGDAAGFDRLRAEREVLDIDADRALAASDRARAQGALAGFFSGAADPSTIVVTAPPGAAPAALPSVDTLIMRAQSSRGELLGLRQEAESARLSARAAARRRIPVPELLAGTKTSTADGGGAGSVFGVQAVLPLFDRGRPEYALAIARAAHADARATAWMVTIRAQISALWAEVGERRAAAGRYRASTGADQLERIAQVSYDAGERGILELLDAYRVGGAARLRQAALDAAVRRAEIELEYVSGWEIP
jgi:cobalt-zinc-cadmium efflux system outer membrane protein